MEISNHLSETGGRQLDVITILNILASGIQ